MASKFCTTCGAELAAGVKFCVACGTPAAGGNSGGSSGITGVSEHNTDLSGMGPNDIRVRMAAQETERPAFTGGQAPVQATVPVYQPAMEPHPYASAYSPDGGHSAAKIPGMFLYLGYIFAMGIPLLGLIPAIIWCVKGRNAARGNLAKAMIVYNVLLTAVFVFLFITFYGILSQVADVSVKWF